MVQPHRRTRGQDRPKPNTGTAGPLRCLPGLLGIYNGGRALYRSYPRLRATHICAVLRRRCLRRGVDGGVGVPPVSPEQERGKSPMNRADFFTQGLDES